jgi:hypothetical protein
VNCRCYRVAPGVFVRVVDCPIHLASGYRLPYLAARPVKAKRRSRVVAAKATEKAAAV